MSRPENSTDTEARMRELVYQHCEPLTDLAAAITHDGDAEDLVQETMLRAWRHLNAVPAGEQAGRRWLHTVARHVAIDASRRRQARPVEVAATAEPVALEDRTAAAAIANVTLREAVAGLSQAHRDVLLALAVENRAPREVAERLGIPIGTVRSRLHYALRALRDQVGH
ncbi:sigma-70 family RNA polymerase sigma factor [Actinoplanes sp. NPDC048796]|uniref:sigma-70 family RNA polymerase sigma factor n=1 Tax=unclassified Actinoplanes TaxID=2626549 RepID=UPI0033F4D775